MAIRPLDENQEAGSGTTRPGRWIKIFLILVPAVFGWWRAAHESALLIDDAYITFRYAENLARGVGLVFNPGQRVLGTTTPLWSGILAGGRLLGLDIPETALWLGRFFTGLACGLLTWNLLIWVRPSLALAAGMVLALHPDVIFFGNSGMETGLNLALILAGLGAISRGQVLVSAMVGGLAFLNRPDGALLILLGAVMAWTRGRRPFIRFAVVATVLCLPWIVFATGYYGSPIPHSVVAKQLAHPAESKGLVRHFTLAVLPVWPMVILALVALPSAGLALVRRTGTWPFAVWFGLYLAGLWFSRISPIFAWYMTPLIPGLMFFAAITLHNGLGLSDPTAPSWRRLAGTLLAGLCWIGLGAWLYASQAWYGPMRLGQSLRVKQYLEIGRWIRSQARPQDKILVGELGALGYTLLDYRVLDGEGIASVELYRLRKRIAEARNAQGLNPRSVDWVKAVIERFQPDWIASWYPFLHLSELTADPQFRAEYVRVTPPGVDPGQFLVWKRRDNP